jgi:glycogen debranching enzyme
MTTETQPFKANHCYAVLDHRGFAVADDPRVTGVMLHDTRHVGDYVWDFPGFELVEQAATGQVLSQYWSLFTDGMQDVLLRRVLTFRGDGFDDVITVTNEGVKVETLGFGLRVTADFVDTFEQRGRLRDIGRNPVRQATEGSNWNFHYVAQDGVASATMISFAGFNPGQPVTLEPGAKARLSVSARFTSDLATPLATTARLEWTPEALVCRASATPELAQAFADIETLAMAGADGTYLAAGVPNYVTLFGRDSLIAAWFLLDAAPGLAEGTLRALSAVQGKATDHRTQEAPGRIPHEIRVSELSRTGDVPFQRYFGTIDAPMLYLILLANHAQRTGRADLAQGLAPNWHSALEWVQSQVRDDGLVRYLADPNHAGKGLTNHVWKDSSDSVSYADGMLATGAIAAIEVQGYTVAAFRAAAALNDICGGDGSESARLRQAADDLAERIDRVFWNDRLGMHVTAVDDAGHPCDTVTSNPGHLLWARAVTPERAKALAARMLQDDLWSGWGLRTLATGEKRYRPLSYHNGSVWPHDTMMFAAGLARYGLTDEARIVTEGIAALAERQPGKQMPELFGGYARSGDTPPLIYVETCRPQAWACAAVVWAGIAGLWPKVRQQEI